jgi:hypothetical protein
MGFSQDTMKLLLAILLCATAVRAEALDNTLLPVSLGEQESGWFSKPKAHEVALLTAAELLILVDVLQSIDMTRYPKDFFEERNPILGGDPTALRFVVLGAAGGLLTAGVWWALPHNWRVMGTSALIVTELAVIFWNHQIGLRIRF